MARPAKFKEAIYESAMKLFGERGLSGTGIREIAKAAGVSEAALYRHWKGKKQLARDIFLGGLAQLCDKLNDEVPADGPICEAIRQTVRIFYEAYDANPDVTLYLLLSEHELWRTMEPGDPNPVAFWFDLLRARASEFELCDELSSEVLGPITLGMILRPGVAAAYSSLSSPLSQYAEAVSTAICRVLGVPGTSPPNAEKMSPPGANQ